MPKLPAVIDKLDAVEEPYRGVYVEQDGKFVLDADVEAHPTVAGLRNTAKATRTERDNVARELKAFKDLGYTPEQIAEIKRKAEEAAGGGGGKPDPEEVARLVKKRVDEALAGVQPQLDRLAAVEAENKKLKLTDGVRAAFVAGGGIEEDADDAVRLTESRFKLNDKGKIVVVDQDGDESSLSPKDWFEKEYKKQRPKFFKGTDASGSGARGTSGGAGEGVQILTPEQASDGPTYRAALAKVGGDHSKVKVQPAA